MAPGAPAFSPPPAFRVDDGDSAPPSSVDEPGSTADGTGAAIPPGAQDDRGDSVGDPVSAAAGEADAADDGFSFQVRSMMKEASEKVAKQKEAAVLEGDSKPAAGGGWDASFLEANQAAADKATKAAEEVIVQAAGRCDAAETPTTGPALLWTSKKTPAGESHGVGNVEGAKGEGEQGGVQDAPGAGFPAPSQLAFPVPFGSPVTSPLKTLDSGTKPKDGFVFNVKSPIAGSSPMPTKEQPKEGKATEEPPVLAPTTAPASVPLFGGGLLSAPKEDSLKTFGALATTSSTGGFNFGTAAAAPPPKTTGTSSLFGFGSTSDAPSAPSQAQSVSAPEAFSFGGASSATESEGGGTNAPFILTQRQESVAMQEPDQDPAAVPLFGSASAAPATLFGNPTSTSMDARPISIFGGAPSSAGFGFNSLAPPASSAPTFALGTSQPLAPTVPSFGNESITSGQPGGLSSMTAAAGKDGVPSLVSSFSPSSFGGSQADQPFPSTFGSTGSGFSSAAPAFPAFGSAVSTESSPSPAVFGVFGSTGSASNTLSPTGFGGFGSTAPAPSSPSPGGFGGFGSSAAAMTSQAPTFGSFGSAAPAVSSSGTAVFTGFGPTQQGMTFGNSTFGGFGAASTAAGAPSPPSFNFGNHAEQGFVFGSSPAGQAKVNFSVNDGPPVFGSPSQNTQLGGSQQGSIAFSMGAGPEPSNSNNRLRRFRVKRSKR
eukprot:evm.model.scf_248EXC.5 EVM.evm.TU.scf_248EXC.5   scf_248EXC:30132-32267(-)